MITVASFSGGKDSTAMLHLLAETGQQANEIIFYETGWEFPQIFDHIESVENKLNIKIVRLRYYRHYDELLTRYGRPHGSGGWCVARKTDTCNKFIRAIKADVEYIGFAYDEQRRAERLISGKRRKWEVKFPLIEAHMTQKDCLEYCYALGYDFGGLYNHFNRVSCFYCPKAEKTRKDTLQEYYPELYAEYIKKDSIAKSKR